MNLLEFSFLIQHELEREAEKRVGHADAGDVVQETLIAAWKRRELLESKDDTEKRKWLFHVNKNNAIDLLRRRKRTQKHVVALDDHEPISNPEPEPFDLRIVAQRLPDEMGRMVQAFLSSDGDTSTIAASLGKSPVQCGREKQRLKEYAQRRQDDVFMTFRKNRLSLEYGLFFPEDQMERVLNEMWKEKDGKYPHFYMMRVVDGSLEKDGVYLEMKKTIDYLCKQAFSRSMNDAAVASELLDALLIRFPYFKHAGLEESFKDQLKEDLLLASGFPRTR